MARKNARRAGGSRSPDVARTRPSRTPQKSPRTSKAAPPNAGHRRVSAAAPVETPPSASEKGRPASGAGPMPRFRAFLAVSLDGYIADETGGVDWLNPYFSPEIDFGAFMKTIGLTVMGRATYDWSMSHGHGAGGAGRAIVMTHRPLAGAPKGVEAFGGDVRELAERLRGELDGTGKDIWLMGGGRCIDAFHAAGLVDRWELGIIPVVLGGGIPLFPRHDRGLGALRMTHSRALSNGIVEVHYEPAGRAS